MRVPRLRKPKQSEFPRVADLAAMPGVDAYDASRALSALYALCCADLAKVYIPAGWHGTHPQRWNVWLEITARRVELTAWVAEWLASQEPSGGDAA